MQSAGVPPPRAHRQTGITRPFLRPPAHSVSHPGASGAFFLPLPNLHRLMAGFRKTPESNCRNGAPVVSSFRKMIGIRSVIITFQKFHAFFDGRIPSITNPPQTNVRDMFPASPMEGSDTVEKNSDFCGTRSGAEEIWRAAARK